MVSYTSPHSLVPLSGAKWPSHVEGTRAWAIPASQGCRLPPASPADIERAQCENATLLNAQNATLTAAYKKAVAVIHQLKEYEAVSVKAGEAVRKSHAEAARWSAAHGEAEERAVRAEAAAARTTEAEAALAELRRTHNAELEELSGAALHLRTVNDELNAGLDAAADTITSLEVKCGLAKARVAGYVLAEQKRAKDGSDSTLRQRLASLKAEVEAARMNEPELRGQVMALTTQLTDATPRRALPTVPVVRLIPPRTSCSPEAPLTARTCHYIRALVNETNCSFEGAATAISVVLALYIEGPPSKEQLICSSSVKAAFDKLGQEDNLLEQRTNQASLQFWAMGCDGGNKGRAIEMMAYCVWDERKQRPVCRPLAASDLFCDQTAKNGTATLHRAASRLGLKPELCVSNTSDGTEHAVQESANFLTEQHAMVALPHGLKLSSQEHCCIHGKALEENAGIESMMPGNRLVDALRLLWEIIKSPEGGRHDEYRVIWIKDAHLPGDLFDSTLGCMAQPTSQKWQVIESASTALSPLSLVSLSLSSIFTAGHVRYHRQAAAAHGRRPGPPARLGRRSLVH